MNLLNESAVEDAALTWFGELGYTVAHGPNLRLEPPIESAAFAPDRALEVEA
jgi:hypothetical protein